MELKTRGDGKKYITVLADGKFHQTVPPGTPGAIEREYEDKNDVLQKKTELVFDEASGYISKLSFEEGDYGKNLKIELDGDGVVSLMAASSFGEDFMKKLPNIDLQQPVKLVPYSFEGTNGKLQKGVSVYQGESKIVSYYYDAEAKKSINGIPEVDGDTTTFDADDWKMHFLKVRKFLMGEVEKIAADMGTFTKASIPDEGIPEGIKEPSNLDKMVDGVEYPDEKINAEDIPF